MLVLVTGVPGSGKTTLIRSVLPYVKVRGSGFFYLNMDDIKNSLVGDTSRQSEEYLKLKPKVLDIVYSILHTNLSTCNNVILEGTFWDQVTNPDWTKDFKALADSNFTELKVIRCIASEDNIKERLKTRAFKRDLDKLETEEAWKAWLQREPIKVPMPTGTSINTEDSLCFLQAIAYIQDVATEQ